MNVRALPDDEEYCPAYAGEYSTLGGEPTGYFSRQERALISSLWMLDNDRVAQFEYLLFAFLHEVFSSDFFIEGTRRRNPRLMAVFRELSNKYIRTWYSTTRNIIPHEKVWDLHMDFHISCKVNLVLLNEILGDINSWKIVLYNRLYVEPKRSLLRKDCEERNI
jgi:hypothetical protein